MGVLMAYFLTGQLGSVAAVTDASGVLVSQQPFDRPRTGLRQAPWKNNQDRQGRRRLIFRHGFGRVQEK